MAGTERNRSCNSKCSALKSGANPTYRGRDIQVGRQGALAGTSCLRIAASGQLILQSRDTSIDAHAKCAHAVKAELPFEHRVLASGRGARVLRHDEIGLETPRSGLIGLVPAAQLVGEVAVGAVETAACTRVHTR